MRLNRDTGADGYGPDDEIAAFASVASHDLRNSLATLRGFLDLIVEEEQFSELGTHLLARVFDVADRMGVLVDDIGEHGRARRQPLEPVTVDVRQAVADALEQLPSAVAQIGATVDVSDVPVVRADRDALVLVLRHVLDNAIRYAGPDRTPRVIVSGHATDSHVTLTVEDDGPGLPEGTEQTVFEPFGKTINSRGHQTTGLGLATAYVLVERMDGAIRAENRPAGGTRITIELPHG